jgi:hypothetical protein
MRGLLKCGAYLSIYGKSSKDNDQLKNIDRVHVAVIIETECLNFDFVQISEFNRRTNAKKMECVSKTNTHSAQAELISFLSGAAPLLRLSCSQSELHLSCQCRICHCLSRHWFLRDLFVVQL